MTIHQEISSHYGIDEELAVDLEKALHVEVWLGVSRAQGFLDYDETLAEAYLGLVEALSTYREGKGASLRHYVKLKIRWAILDLMRSTPYTYGQGPMAIDAVSGAEEAYYEVHRAIEALGRCTDIEQEIITQMVLGERRDVIAAKLGVSERRLNRVLSRYRLRALN